MPDRRTTMAGAAVRSRRKRRRRLTTGQKAALTLAILIVLGGAAALAYPAFSQWWNARDQSAVVADYAREIGGLDDSDAEEQLRRARDYNRNLTDVVAASDPFTEEGTVDTTDYNTLLWATQEGVMAYVEIPKINVLLPIYHGGQQCIDERRGPPAGDKSARGRREYPLCPGRPLRHDPCPAAD